MNLRRAKVVMLPTEDKTHIFILNKQTHIGFDRDMTLHKDHGTNQHLYITTDDEIKEGDYVYFPISEEILKIGNGPYEASIETLENETCYKVIATTNPNLQIGKTKKSPDDIKYKHLPIYLPSLSQLFIEKYCKLGGISEVDIEYIVNESNCVEKNGVCADYLEHECKDKGYRCANLKINSHNEIAIHSIKDSYTRAEVESLIYKYIDDNNQGAVFDTDDEWIKENL